MDGGRKGGMDGRDGWRDGLGKIGRDGREGRMDGRDGREGVNSYEWEGGKRGEEIGRGRGRGGIELWSGLQTTKGPRSLTSQTWAGHNLMRRGIQEPTKIAFKLDIGVG